ncbi:MAG: Crp/Fnr family transcriptional regulator [Bacteroidetes bacterium]|nr:Crp/Fnr family transcriptional regulator [Bacteroidota bacterium]
MVVVYYCMQSLIQFIQNTVPIPLDKAKEIAAYFEERKIEKGNYFLQEGHKSNEYMFLLDGFMRAYATDTEGNDITTAFYTTNNVVFEVSSFFNRTPSKENIQALTPCAGLVISYDTLNNLFHGLPEFREFGRAVLVRGFSALKARMLGTITETAEQRYLTLLHTNPDIFQQAPLKMIASYLGITDTSLSRIRKEVSKK